MLVQKIRGATAGKIVETPTLVFRAVASSTAEFEVFRPTAVPGDLLVVFLYSPTTTTPMWQAPSGWVSRFDQAGRAVCTRIVGVSEPTSYIFTQLRPVPIAAKQSVTLCFKDAVFDVAGVLGLEGNPSIAPAVTLAASGSYVLAFFSTPTEAGSLQDITMSTPENYTQLARVNFASNRPNSFMFGKRNSLIGTTGDVQTNVSNTSGAAVTTTRGILVGVKPA